MRPRSPLTRPARRPIRPLAAAALAAVLAAGTVVAGGTAAAPPASASDSGVREATTAQPSIDVTTRDGGVVTPGADVVATVTIDNTTGSTLDAGAVAVSISSAPLTSRSAFAGWRSADSDDAVGRRVAEGSSGSIAPGRSEQVEVTIPAASIGITTASPAAYGLAAELETAGSDPVGRGAIVWNPGGSASPTRLAVAVPITVPADSASRTGLIPSDDLETYTQTTGILTRQLDAVAGHDNVAVGVDPMIIASIRALGTSAPASATNWLERLAGLTQETFPLQFGDADVAGQVQSGQSTLLAPTSLDYALDPADFQAGIPDVGSPTPTPTADFADVTPSTPTPTASPGPAVPTLEQLTAWNWTHRDIAWPAASTVRAGDPAVFAANGLTTTLLSAGNADDSTRSAPDAHAASGSAQLLVADGVISDALGRAAGATDGSAGDPVWNGALSAANAELAVIGAETGQERTVVAFAGRGAPQSWVRMSQAYTALSTSPWAGSATLTDALAAPVAASVSIDEHAESSSRIAGIQSLTTLEQQIAAFSSVVTEPETLTGRTRAKLLALLGVAWLDDTYDWPSAVDASNSASNRILNAVHIDTTTPVRLLANTASIPIIVSNDLDDLSIDIVLRASPSNGRLEVQPSTATVIQPSSNARILVPVTAKLGNGRVRLQLDVYSTTDAQVAPPVTLPVTVSADWEGIATAVLGIALVLLFAGGIVRTVLRRRRRSRDGDGDGMADGEGAAADGDADPDAPPIDELEAAPEADVPARERSRDG